MHIYYTSLLYTRGKIDVSDRMRHEMIHVHYRLLLTEWRFAKANVMWPEKKAWLTISDLLLNNAFASVRLLRVFLPDDIKSSSRSSCIMYYLRREGARVSGCEENASLCL